MINKVLFLVLAVTSLTVSAQQRGVRIGYVDMEYILQNVDEYKEASAQLDKKVQKWKGEVEEQKNTIVQMRKDLSAEKILLTRELVEEREEEIKALEAEMFDYQQDRFGPAGDLVLQRKMLVQPLQDQVFNAVQEIAQNRGYDFIFDKSADVVMLYSDKRHDLSDMILRTINRHRKQGISGGVVDKFDEDADKDLPVNEEAEAKKQETLDKRDQRQKEIEEQRQKKLEEIEARKKAYEERRKKMLEEREARRKQILEERNKKIDSIQ